MDPFAANVERGMGAMFARSVQSGIWLSRLPELTQLCSRVLPRLFLCAWKLYELLEGRIWPCGVGKVEGAVLVAALVFDFFEHERAFPLESRSTDSDACRVATHTLQRQNSIVPCLRTPTVPDEY